jgi:RHS repeat-associated protein
MLEIREDQLEAMRKAVRAGLPDAISASMRARGLAVARDEQSIAATDGRGHTTRLFFQPDGAPQRLLLPSGQEYRLVCDDRGRLSGLDHSGGGRVELGYDAEGRMASVRRPGIDEHRFEYDDRGRLAALRWPDGGVQRFEHDAEGRLTVLVDRTGARTERQRDGSGHLAAIRDPLGRETRFSAADGALEAVVFPDGSREEYAFDPDRNVATVTLRNGRTVFHTLDHRGAVQAIDWEDGEWVSFELDAEDRLVAARGPAGEVAFVHDAAGELRKERTDAGVVQMRHDGDGRLVELRTPFGDAVRYVYDEDGRLQTVVDWNGDELRYRYAPDGTVAALRYGNGLVEQQSYAATGRLAEAEVKSGRDTVSRQRYAYDVCGRLVEVEDRDPTVGWLRRLAHDPEGRLTSVVDGSGALLERFEHDEKGNIVRDGQSTVVVGAMDQVLRHGTDEIGYDDLGNVTRLPGERGPLALDFSDGGRLRAARSGDRLWRYEYDALGRRILKTDGRATWRFGWVGHQLLWEEYQEAPGARGVRRDWLWLPDSVVPVAFREGGRTYWLQHDGRGAPIRAFREDGTIAWSARYDAYGRAHVEVAHVRQPWRLAGQYHDEETGLHYSLGRYYSPRIKSYLSRDPEWQEPGATAYGYARSCPYELADPFGALPFLLLAVGAVAVGAAVGAVVAAVTGGDPVAGAVGGGMAVVGAIVGGLVGGPVGVVAGGMIGSTAGAFAESLIEQARKGDPLCLACAAKEAAIALGIDVALLGLGKIPGVKRLVRKLGNKLLKKGEKIRQWARKQIVKVNPRAGTRWANRQATKAPHKTVGEKYVEQEARKKRAHQIGDNFDNYDKLPDNAKPNINGKPLDKSRVEQAFKGDPNHGGERLPLPFKDWDEYDAFRKDVDDALRRGGVDDAVVQQVGSGTTGWAGNPKKFLEVDGKPTDYPKPWSNKSDTDFAVFSEKGMAQAYEVNTPVNKKVVLNDEYAVFKNGVSRGRGINDTPVGQELDKVAKKWNEKVYGDPNVDGFDFKLNTTPNEFGANLPKPPGGGGPVTTVSQRPGG